MRTRVPNKKNMLRKQTNAANELCLLSVANYARNITLGETDANIKYIGSVDRNTALSDLKKEYIDIRTLYLGFVDKRVVAGTASSIFLYSQLLETRQ